MIKRAFSFNNGTVVDATNKSITVEQIDKDFTGIRFKRLYLEGDEKLDIAKVIIKDKRTTSTLIKISKESAACLYIALQNEINLGRLKI